MKETNKLFDLRSNNDLKSVYTVYIKKKSTIHDPF